MTREWSSSALLYLILLSDLALIQVLLWPKWESVLGKHGNLPRLHIDLSMSCHGRSENPFWANMEICFGSSAHLYLHPSWANCLSDLALIQVSLWPKWETVLGKHGNLPRLHVMAEVRICFGQTWKSASAVRHTCISTLPEQTAYLILLWFKFRSGRSENPFWANMEICFGFILTCQCHVMAKVRIHFGKTWKASHCCPQTLKPGRELAHYSMFEMVAKYLFLTFKQLLTLQTLQHLEQMLG